MNFNIMVGAFAVTLLIWCILALYCGQKSAEAKLEKDVISSANFATLERIFIGLLCVTFLGFLLICFQDNVTTGFANILRDLEELKNG